MKLNNITSYGYELNSNQGYILFQCSPEQALQIDTSLITVTTDDGDFVESYVGFSPISVTLDAFTGYCTLNLVKEDNTLMQTLTGLTKQIQNQQEIIEQQKELLNIQSKAIIDLGNYLSDQNDGE